MATKQTTRLRFIGTEQAPVSFKPNDTLYHGAADGVHTFIEAQPEDLAKLVESGKWVLAEGEGEPLPTPPLLAPAASVPENRWGSLQDLNAREAVATVKAYVHAGLPSSLLETWQAEELAGRNRNTVLAALDEALAGA